MNAVVDQLELDEEKLQEFAGKVLEDITGALTVLLGFMGDQAGVYRAMAIHGPATVTTIAEKAGVDERYPLEWLSAQAAAGYVKYDPSEESFALTPEQATVLSAEGHPACMQGLMQQVASQFTTHEKALETFRSGDGRSWADHHSGCFCGTDRFFRAGYNVNLLENWLPALEGVEAKLRAGARVADIGCGLGSSTLLMARAYPNSRFDGFDIHPPSIEEATMRANAADGAGNAKFEARSAKETPANDYDLMCMFDCLHDMGDPVGAARRIRECLADDGTLMLVEPLAGDTLSDNLNPLGQLFYAASTLICTPASKDQEVGLALGAQAGEARLTTVLREAGFSRIRRASETATNMVLEARP